MTNPGVLRTTIEIESEVGVGTRSILEEDSNLWVGTDLLNDAENFSIAYSQDNDEVRTIQKFKFGTEVSFPARIVEFTTTS